MAAINAPAHFWRGGLMGNVGGSGGQELGSGMWDLESGSLGAGGMEMR